MIPYLEGFAAVLLMYFPSANGITPVAIHVPMENYELCQSAKAEFDKTFTQGWSSIKSVCLKIRK